MRFLEKLLIILSSLIGLLIIGTIILLLAETKRGFPEQSLVLTAPQLPPPTCGIVISVTGEAYLYRQGNWSDVNVGDFVQKEDYLKTFARARVDLQIGERLIFTITENTVLRLNELLQTSENLRTEAELLFGRVAAKLTRLSGSDQVRVKTGSTAFGVKGTTFLLWRQAELSSCAVAEGQVSLLDLKTGRELYLLNSGMEIQVSDERTGPLKGQPMSLENQKFLASLEGLSYVSFKDLEAKQMVKLVIRVKPPTAAIYLSGNLVGYGEIGTMILADKTVPVILKQDGYREQSFTLKTTAGEHRIYEFALELAEPQEGLEEIKPPVESSPTPEPPEVLSLRKELKETKQKLKQSEDEKIALKARNKELEELNQKLNAENLELRSKIEGAIKELQMR